MLAHMLEDLAVVERHDPAARSRLESALCHSPLHAIWIHRVAHALHRVGAPLLARTLSTFARFATGVEIHPAARIGRRFFIDHGTGVVIGETAEIGDDCVLFHNVTLGGTGRQRGKRHPTLGHRVYVGTGATLLGPILVGDDARIGAHTLVLNCDVPPDTTVVGSPPRIVRLEGEAVDLELPRSRTSSASRAQPTEGERSRRPSAGPGRKG